MNIKFRVAKKHNDKDWLEHCGEDGSQEKDYFIVFEVDEIYFDDDCIYGECSIGSLCQNVGGDYDVVEESFDTSNGDILMQYTGLKDKNGKEIYEGDVVKYESIYGCLGVGVVDFDEGMFCVSHLSLAQLDVIEIIGNIYENKELLND